MTEIHKEKILIIDDEELIRNILTEILGEKYLCAAAESGEKALEFLKRETFDLVLSDIDLGDISGIEIVPKILERSPETVVVMISGKQTIESAIDAMRVGAFDYIKKPFEIEQVENAVRRALDQCHLLKAKQSYEKHLENLVRQRTDELQYLAFHDALTDLPNRILFEDRLFQALAQSRRSEGKIAVLFVSLDRFKLVSDALGHITGFKLLQQTAERLKKCAGENVTVARFEGDEFALLCANFPAPNEIREIAALINREIEKQFEIDGHEIFTTASVGVSFFPEDGEELQTILKNAGIALSRAREKGGNTFEFYTHEMNLAALKRAVLENDLRHALERGELEVYFQPKIDVATHQIVGMEALARWQHPKTGAVSPAEFIPLAEETGLIIQLGEQILREACRQNKEWQDAGFAPIPMSVNISPRHLENGDLPKLIAEIIAETGLEAKYLELEVTESSIMNNPDYAVKKLHELKKLGIKISIDDFGTGYSSLSYLKHLPIDVLKIDKAFVQDLAINPDDAALVMTIITLAHQLRLKVVAEGVENEDQLRFLHLLRCDEWQGFYYSKPVPAEDFTELLKNDKR